MTNRKSCVKRVFDGMRAEQKRYKPKVFRIRNTLNPLLKFHVISTILRRSCGSSS